MTLPAHSLTWKETRVCVSPPVAMPEPQLPPEATFLGVRQSIGPLMWTYLSSYFQQSQEISQALKSRRPKQIQPERNTMELAMALTRRHI